jgi:polyisoprenoid-binding protein YceI
MNMAWNIDPAHSSINFSVRHLMIAKVRGTFTKWQARVDYNDSNPALSKIEVRIDAASIDTKESQRDAHLRSPDFLDAEKFPELVFTSREITRDGEDYVVAGDMAIHGITRPVRLQVESLGTTKDPWGNQRMAFAAKTALNRKDFGLTWNQALEAGGVLVGEKVEIEIDVELVKAA